MATRFSGTGTRCVVCERSAESAFRDRDIVITRRTRLRTHFPLTFLQFRPPGGFDTHISDS